MFGRLQCHLPAHSQAGSLNGVAKLCSPRLAWSWTVSKWWLFCVPEICPDIPLASTSWLEYRSGFGPWWCGLSITGIVWPGQSSLELRLPDLPSAAAIVVCPGTDRTWTVATCCFLAEQRWQEGTCTWNRGK